MITFLLTQVNGLGLLVYSLYCLLPLRETWREAIVTVVSTHYPQLKPMAEVCIAAYERGTSIATSYLPCRGRRGKITQDCLSVHCLSRNSISVTMGMLWFCDMLVTGKKNNTCRGIPHRRSLKGDPRGRPYDTTMHFLPVVYRRGDPRGRPQ